MNLVVRKCSFVLSGLLGLTAASWGAVVGVVGGGPAGMAMIEELFSAGHQVILIDAAPYVGGNMAHGYFYEKGPKFEETIKKFREMMSRPDARFFGKVKVGETGDISFSQLSELNLDALVFTSGAIPRTLGIPGEEAAIPASKVFYYYNGHHDFPDPPAIGKRVVVIGSGNSSADVIEYLMKQNRGIRFTMMVRGGPGQYGFKEKDHLQWYFSPEDLRAYQAEIRRIAPKLEAIGDSAEEYMSLSANRDPGFPDNAGNLRVLHLVSPLRIFKRASDKIYGVEVAHNQLVSSEAGVTYIKTGRRTVIEADTVITSLGGAVNLDLNLPLAGARVRTLNAEDVAIRRDLDVKDPIHYFKTRTLDHYQVDFTGAVAPPFPVFVAGWARLPGIGSTLRERGFSNVPDGRTLAQLLIAKLGKGGSVDFCMDQLKAASSSLGKSLKAKGTKFKTRPTPPPKKRARL